MITHTLQFLNYTKCCWDREGKMGKWWNIHNYHIYRLIMARLPRYRQIYMFICYFASRRYYWLWIKSSHSHFNVNNGVIICWCKHSMHCSHPLSFSRWWTCKFRCSRIQLSKRKSPQSISGDDWQSGYNDQRQQSKAFSKITSYWAQISICHH